MSQKIEIEKDEKESKVAEVKQFLRGIRDLDSEIEAKFDQIEELHSLATRRTSAPSKTGEVQTGTKKDTMESTVIKIVELTEALDDTIKKMLAKKSSAMTIIEQLKDSRYKTILYQYYFNSKTWEQIAVEMHYTYKWVHVLHGRALVDFAEVFENMKNST